VSEYTELSFKLKWKTFLWKYHPETLHFQKNVFKLEYFEVALIFLKFSSQVFTKGVLHI